MGTKVTKQMRTETSHLLPGHPGRCRNLHGHSYLWEVSLEAEHLKLTGMVEDFGDLKKVMMEVIDPFDHAFVFDDSDDVSMMIAEALKHGGADRIMPVGYLPTAENFAQYVWGKIKNKYPQMIVTIRVWETATSYAEFSDPRIIKDINGCNGG